MEEEDFFKRQSASSSIKAKIVAEYFPKYCRILLSKPQKMIRYLDLFAGPGLYEDSNHSTPLLLAKTCAEDPILSSKVHLMFNDNKYSEQLKENFDKYFPDGTFVHKPRFGSLTIGESDEIKKFLSKDPVGGKNPSPTLLFFDPWGYKGIDTLVLAKFLANWGNEIFLFVNIKRIHAAIENKKFDELMQSLFPTTIEQLRKDRKYKATVYDRLNLIMENLASEFKKAVNDNLYHCAFKFQEEDNTATSHFIVHFTKHPKGYELVKQIYYEFDNLGATLEKDGSYTFDVKRMGQSSDSMLNFGDQNVAALSDILENKYKGRSITALDLFNEHHPTTKYAFTHYSKTLRRMVEVGKVKSTYTNGSEHKVTVLLNEHCLLEFK